MKDSESKLVESYLKTNLSKKQNVKELREFEKLRSLTGSSDDITTTTWHILKLMQEELSLPANITITDLYNLYRRLEDIRTALDLQIRNFSQLNQLNFELMKIREIFGFSTNTSISDIFAKLNPEIVTILGTDSLLWKLLTFKQSSEPF
ncbi:MAG: hypothetical protein ACFFFH_08490 [Candidatus Thorarchaeota archaeon]